MSPVLVGAVEATSGNHRQCSPVASRRSSAALSLPRKSAGSWAGDSWSRNGAVYNLGSGSVKFSRRSSTPKVTLAPEHLPVRVEVRVTVMKIGKVDTSAATVEIEAFVHFYWRDPLGLGGKEGAKAEQSQWRPRVTISNATEMSVEESDPVYIAEPDLWRGEFVARGLIHNPMNLRRYPFDYDDIVLRLDTMQHAQCTSEVQLLPLEEYSNEHTFRHSVGFFPTYDPVDDMQEWQLHCVSISVKEVTYDAAFPQLLVSFTVRRFAFFYVAKILVPLFTSTMLSFACAWMDLKADFPSRMSFIAMMFLSTTAYLQIVSANMPHVSYLTLLDKAVSATLVVTILIGVETMLMRALLDTYPELVQLDRQLLYWSFLVYCGLLLMVMLPDAVRHHIAMLRAPSTRAELEVPCGQSLAPPSRGSGHARGKLWCKE